MSSVIVLDSGPLGLLFQKPGIPDADACRAWLAGQLGAGKRVIVPEVVHYELRRELLRLGKTRAVAALDAFGHSALDRYLAITTPAMLLAAELWAQARRRGMPTADRVALDVDVILAAQVLTAGLVAADFVVATSNLGHLAQFVPAQTWPTIV
jgi:predicted nucleic acid-binding protein